MATTRSGASGAATRVGSMLSSDWAVAIWLTTTSPEWQCMTWPWYCDAARATLAWPCNRQSGAHTIQDWARRNAATVRSPTERTSGVRGIMRSKVAASARWGQGGTYRRFIYRRVMASDAACTFKLEPSNGGATPTGKRRSTRWSAMVPTTCK